MKQFLIIGLLASAMMLSGHVAKAQDESPAPTSTEKASINAPLDIMLTAYDCNVEMALVPAIVLPTIKTPLVSDITSYTYSNVMVCNCNHYADGYNIFGNYILIQPNYNR